MTLVGPFLTRSEFARRAGVPTTQLELRTDLLRIRGPVQETYFAFQLNGHSIHPGLGSVVRSLCESHDALIVADWLVRPHPRLQSASPLQCIRNGRGAADVLAAARVAGPGSG